MIGKKHTSMILCVVVLFSLSACRKQENVKDSRQWMPFGLEFGMTYDEFSQQLSEAGVAVPALSPADANVGFVTDAVKVDVNDGSVWDFLGSPTMKKLASEEEIDTSDVVLWFAKAEYTESEPRMYFSFNQDQKLYEFYCFWETGLLGNLPSCVIPEIITNYNSKLGVAQSTTDSSGAWNNNEHSVSIAYHSEDYRMALVHHCITYNLDS